jgi:hypothetical protein
MSRYEEELAGERPAQTARFFRPTEKNIERGDRASVYHTGAANTLVAAANAAIRIPVPKCSVSETYHSAITPDVHYQRLFTALGDSPRLPAGS